jgi:hypothetical protein
MTPQLYALRHELACYDQAFAVAEMTQPEAHRLNKRLHRDGELMAWHVAPKAGDCKRRARMDGYEAAMQIIRGE